MVFPIQANSSLQWRGFAPFPGPSSGAGWCCGIVDNAAT